ncbi:MAG: heme A synthase, partial [Rhodospirillales bacterium 20-64-7]
MKADRAVGNWLLLLAAMVFGMVAGGGHARTIGAGFVIQSWHPVTGFIPPLSAAAWAREFSLFQHTAQYQAQPLDLAQFKSLFWPMFLDRCWGRLMALVFLLPFGVFLLQRRISRRLGLWLAVIFAAGAGQAVFGWYMVKTGRQAGVLSPPPEWAAPHFLSAMVIFAALLWTGLAIRNPAPEPEPHGAFLKPWLNASVLLILATMGFGALVATSGAL